MMRRFLPQVDWAKLASMYIKNRSAAECEARWMSSEDPLINHGPWDAEEDKKLRLIVEDKTEWLGIALSLGTNRTPFQCLSRYQRSLNADMLRKEWTRAEDDLLRDAVGSFGDKDWQSVLEGRTGAQCSDRWRNSLQLSIQKKGKWSSEEEKRLKVAVTNIGAGKWCKIAQFVPGRTQSQCQSKWKTLDPKVKHGSWTEEEDAKLREATTGLDTKLKNLEFGRDHGYWSKVASHMSGRTSFQCLRRWKILNPGLVPLTDEATRLRRENTLGNFVDRESERPDLVACENTESSCADTSKRQGKRLERSSGDACTQGNETEDNVKVKKQRRKRKSVAGTSNISSV